MNSLCCVCIIAYCFLVSSVLSYLFSGLIHSSSFIDFPSYMLCFDFHYQALPSLILILPSLFSLTLLFRPMDIHRHIEHGAEKCTKMGEAVKIINCP